MSHLEEKFNENNAQTLTWSERYQRQLIVHPQVGSTQKLFYARRRHGAIETGKQRTHELTKLFDD
jgi:hypothetical protein